MSLEYVTKTVETGTTIDGIDWEIYKSSQGFYGVIVAQSERRLDDDYRRSWLAWDRRSAYDLKDRLVEQLRTFRAAVHDGSILDATIRKTKDGWYGVYVKVGRRRVLVADYETRAEAVSLMTRAGREAEGRAA